ncbi:PREDICTED: FAD-dependent oxidoreductase domain-containing protein 1-like [Habropoda laboriosa]|uniref:FAD-dependent oxidoreductase domain-containing protein 1-like n=1 Tax=Habropoda laboriosa TaxID=597456 RepID=UPI00083E4543|nr:PREDICTED: FAD-dependent oxidoreductase domain-containing protein 1-like [Habropoda laboriosa]
MVPTMPPDSHKISLKIIEAIKQHPVLYSAEVKGSSVKLQEFRQKVWKRISDELGLDPTWVRLRWKNLRDTYCRILKYKNRTEKGVRRKKWIFEDHLNFLKFPYESDYQPQSIELTEDYIQDINAGGISSEGLLEQLEDRNDEDYSEYLEVLEETTADPILDRDSMELNDNNDGIVKSIEVEDSIQHDIDTYAQQIQSKYRKIRPKKMKVEPLEVPTTYSILKTSPFKNRTVDTPVFVTTSTTNNPIKNSSKVEDTQNNYDQVYLAPEGKSSIELFFDSMAQTVKRLPPKAQADIKMNICKIVTEAELRYSGRNIPQSTQQFIAPPGMIPKLVLIPCNMIDGQNNKVMKMLQFFIKIRAQNNILQKNGFLQIKRTFTEKDINNRLIRKEKGSNTITPKKLKNNLVSMENSLDVKEDDNFLIKWMDRPPIIPQQCDIIIIGGGVIGSSIAYWLKKRVYSQDFKVIVVERDPMYTTASTVLSAGGLRQQFSLKENIEMSLFGAEFIRNINDYLGIEGQPVIDLSYHPYGYLMLASEKGAERLTENSKLQNFLGAKNMLLSAAKLKHIFPWLNTEDIELGCLGLEKEGWFDPWSLLCAFKQKALILGAQYICGEACGFVNKDDDELPERLDKLVVSFKFSFNIISHSSFSGEIAKMAKIGIETDIRQICLPVEPRKRYIYCFHSPDGPGLNTPLTIDYSGTYFRNLVFATGFSGHGIQQAPAVGRAIAELIVDGKYMTIDLSNLNFDRIIHGSHMSEINILKSSWAGYYEFNTFDQNGIIGSHPYHRNLVFATGFSGHGIQQAPAVGRAIAELIVDGKYMTIDLSNLNFDRIIHGSHMSEINIV